MSEDHSLTHNDISIPSFDDQSSANTSKGNSPSSTGGIASDAQVIPVPIITTVPRSGSAPTAQQAPVEPSVPAPVPTQQIPTPLVQPPAVPTYAQQPPTPYVAPTPVSMPIATPSSPTPRQEEKRPKSKLLILGIILCVVALLTLAATFAIFYFHLFDQEEPAPEAPSASQVETAYEGAEVDAPDLSTFKYIDTENLTGPKISDYRAGNVTSEGETFYCEGLANATYENDALSVQVPLSMRMQYNEDSSSWMRGTVREGTLNAKPKVPADIDEIVSNFPAILKSKDPNLATQFEGCQITPEASLTTEGGTANFTLTKDIDGQTKTCTVKTTVSWNGERGWVVTIASIEGLDNNQTPPAEQKPTENPDANNGGNNGSGGSSGGGTTNLQPTMLLVCYSGDLVEVPGTVQIQSDGRVLLRTDDVIRVEFDNRVYITTYFELTGTGGFIYGQHILAKGAISATGNLPEAPLVINFNWA